MGRKLHIGGQVRAEGWEVLDANPGPAVDHVQNARSLTAFADGSFDHIYASHVVEHFDYKDELVAVLREWHRVLVPGGLLFVSVPDLDTLARMFADQALTLADRFLVMRMIFGGHVDRYDYHLVGLNFEFLSQYLALAGFAAVQRVERLGVFNDTSELRLKGTLISLNIVAAKAPIPPELTNPSRDSG